MTISTIVFDAYGTLFDVNGAARMAARESGDAFARGWEKLSADWRDRQLHYTWLRAITGQHVDFGHVTADALTWAMEANGIDDPNLRARLLALYDELPAYPEVREVLSALKDKGHKVAILSNGTPGMLEKAVGSAGIGKHLDAVLSVEEVGVYKPDARVYDLVGQRFGCDKEEVLFVTSNFWDAAGATGYGFITAWVNRDGAARDRLWSRPTHALPNLTGIVDLA
ncbi:haloacid dehalogenase type II [Limimaricola pyoseonensis]|uniref:(S)-2-haloacid dehalogenase n=1 Tax=Limimaricola pyoseonensis TaxID=521013 RepID=A0A1G7G769_9RHOB|nr:haloacid dehalogenase type II [Limimaricola pyoseonensis]SDE83988.1 2-haloacid dehalogenase [Limimaricola pyoseonensis]